MCFAWGTSKPGQALQGCLRRKLSLWFPRSASEQSWYQTNGGASERSGFRSYARLTTDEALTVYPAWSEVSASRAFAHSSPTRPSEGATTVGYPVPILQMKQKLRKVEPLPKATRMTYAPAQPVSYHLGALLMYPFYSSCLSLYFFSF